MPTDVLYACCVLAAPALALAQASATSASVGVVADVDVYAKVVGGVLTGMGTLFGLPLVFWSYKKTRIEINKLELEAAALRRSNAGFTIEGGPKTDDGVKGLDGGTRINVDHSQNVTVQVLADPRFLGPLLLLLDFIFAWIVLTLASYFFDIVQVGIFRTLVLAALAVLMLLPIAKEALRVRSVLRPPRSSEEHAATVRQAKLIAYLVFVVVTTALLAFGSLLFTATNLTSLGRFLAWTLLIAGAVAVVSAPLLKARVDRYLVKAVGTPPTTHADE